MPVRTYATTLYNDEAMVAPLLSRVCSIVTDAGYVYSEEASRRSSVEGAPGSYVCDEIDVDGRTGTRTYDFRVFEDPQRPVIDQIIATLRNASHD
jgi:hypothetical protein